MVEVMMNATSSGLGIVNQGETVGTAMGIGFLVVIVALPILAHYILKYEKQLKWFWRVGLENVLYGFWTISVVFAIKAGWDFFTKPKNAAGTFEALGLVVQVLLGLFAVAVLGYFAKPIWNWMYEYAFVAPKKEVRQNE